MHTKMPAIAISAMLLLVACLDGDRTPTALARVTPPFLAKGGPQPAIPLRVTVDDLGPSGPYRIQSDGLGDYVNGVQGMRVEFDGPGNLQFTPLNGNLTTPPQRTLTHDFSAPTDPLTTYRTDESAQHNFKIKTGNYLKPRIQDLGVNGNAVSGCYETTMAHESGSVATHHLVIFNPLGDPQTGYAYITRTSVSPATWSMVSDGPCEGLVNVARVWSQDVSGRKAGPLIFRGYFNLRFSLQFRAL